MRPSRALPVALLLTVALLLAGPRPAVAQDGTPTPAAASTAAVSSEEVAIATLAEATLETLPSAPAPVVLARITFDPGSGLSMTANPALALHYVESGSFAVFAVAPMTLVRAATAGTPVPKVPISEDDEFVISRGDLLVIPANTLFEVRNTSQEPAIALIIELFGRDPGAAVPPG